MAMDILLALSYFRDGYNVSLADSHLVVLIFALSFKGFGHLSGES